MDRLVTLTDRWRQKLHLDSYRANLSSTQTDSGLERKCLSRSGTSGRPTWERQGYFSLSSSCLVFRLSIGCLVAPTIHIYLEKLNFKSKKCKSSSLKTFIKSMTPASALSPTCASQDACLLLFFAPTNQSPIPALGASNWGGVQRLCTCALSNFLM